MVIAQPAVVVPPHTAPLPATASVVAHANPAPHGWTRHAVRLGDSVSALAVRYRTTVATIVAKNHLPAHGRVIHPGQRLWVPRTSAPVRRPTARPVKRPAAPVRVHVVRSGDTLFDLAVRYRTTVSRIWKANGLTSTTIHPGQRLRVPGRAPAPSRTKVTNQRKKPASPARKRPTRTRPGALQVTTNQSRLAVRDQIAVTARRYGVDPRLAMAIGWQESGWSQNQVSSAHAYGVMQVIPDAGDWASSMVGRRLNLRRTSDNITAGVVILRALTRMADSRDQAIAAYYQGLGSVRERGLYEDTKQYVRNVNWFRTRL